MDARKSLGHRVHIMDSPVASSSPLRRKSVAIQESPLPENDDEAERTARRLEIRSSASSRKSTVNSSDRRHSLGLTALGQIPVSQMAARITECIKLSVENKINIKNAFNLEIIDFMTYMVRKEDVNMSNLQMASTSLEVCSKIYGYRVDSIYTDVLKMVGDLGTQNKNDDEMSVEEGARQNVREEEQVKAKKKRIKQKIFSTVEALKGNVEVTKPTPLAIEDDQQTMDRLFLVSLPIHANSGYCPHRYSDVIVDEVNDSNTQSESIKVVIPKIDDLSHLEICSSLHNFKFQSVNRDENDSSDENDNSNFQFDLDASLPADDEPQQPQVDFFDIEMDQENVNPCSAEVNRVVENITDFRQIISSSASSKPLEYSFVQKSMNMHWAGPSHWKNRNFVRFHDGSSESTNEIMRTCQQTAAKKRKELELLYDQVTDESIEEKFSQSTSVKYRPRFVKTNWFEEPVTLPQDVHYDILTEGSKLYFHCLPINTNQDQMNPTHVSDVIENYNYNNENDTLDYCPDVNNEDCQSNEENNNDAECDFRSGEEGGINSQMALIGDNLVPVPKMANKTMIPYCTKAKKVDMRQLKQSIWKCLTSSSEENTQIEASTESNATTIVEVKHFSDVYKTLPKILTKNNADALSVPLAFASLLDVANTKNLKIEATLDLSDLIVQQDTCTGEK